MITEKRGFALVELIMTVILLLMIFTYSFAYPFSQKIENSKKIDRFVTDIAYVRSLSSSGEEAYIKIGDDMKSYILCADGKRTKVKFKEGLKITCYSLKKIEFKLNHTDGNTIKITAGRGRNKVKYKITIACITGRINCFEEQ